MLAIVVDLAGEAPVYRQIADEVRRLIAQGALLPGAELPSVRQLGQWIGVNLNTVAKAYRILADEGAVELKQGASARVAAKPQKSKPRTLTGDDDGRRRVREVISRWILMGADRKTVDLWLEQIVGEYFTEDHS